MRSVLSLAGPINSINKRYMSLEDDEDAQEEVVEKFSEDLMDLCESNDDKYKSIERLAFN